MGLSYKDVGVDIEKADEFVSSISDAVKSTKTEQTVRQGGYAGLYDVSNNTSNILAATCDGVGTKMLVAKELNDYSTIGIDLVAMSVNDLLASGAAPMFFLDYIATGKIEPDVLKSIVGGIVDGCKESHCALLAGETAEMPDMYRPGDIDLAGFAVGNLIFDVNNSEVPVHEGNIAIYLPSNGIHSSGLTLARRVSENIKWHRKEFLQELLRPTEIYRDDVLDLLSKHEPIAMAHITGGGFEGRVRKLIPYGCDFLVDNFPDELDVFKVISEYGPVGSEEMFNTFNMGVGFVAIMSRDSAEEYIKEDNRWERLGVVVDGTGEIEYY